MDRLIIGVIGGRRVKKALLEEAAEVGKLIAQKGLFMLCGGLGGVMEAAARGARAAGGTTIGILPQDKKEHANTHITIPIPTGLGIGRNIIIARSADALIAVGGEYGTLSEIAFSLQLGKPVVGIETWDIRGVIRADSAFDAVEKAIEAAKNSPL